MTRQITNRPLSQSMTMQWLQFADTVEETTFKNVGIDYYKMFSMNTIQSFAESSKINLLKIIMLDPAKDSYHFDWYDQPNDQYSTELGDLGDFWGLGHWVTCLLCQADDQVMNNCGCLFWNVRRWYSASFQFCSCTCFIRFGFTNKLNISQAEESYAVCCFSIFC